MNDYTVGLVVRYKEVLIRATIGLKSRKCINVIERGKGARGTSITSNQII